MMMVDPNDRISLNEIKNNPFIKSDKGEENK